MVNENKVYRRELGKGIAGYTWQTVEIPTPGYGQVLIRVHAVSLNYRDVLMAKGAYGRSDIPPVIPISDGAGEVVKIGEGVAPGAVKVGDRVMPNFLSAWVDGEITEHFFTSSLGDDVDGVGGQYVLARADTLVQIPSGLSYEEAATLPCAAVTAWNALFEGPAPLRVGETVLVEGTGGVSIFALQFAVAAGARVIITSSSNEKLQKAKDLGASATINYKERPDWDQEVLQLTGGKGVDHVVEVGGVDSVKKAINAVRFLGQIHVVGGVSGYAAGFTLWDTIKKVLRIHPVVIGSSKMFERMNAAITLHKIKPVVDQVFEFEKLQDALQYLEGGSHFGKVVVRVN